MNKWLIVYNIEGATKDLPERIQINLDAIKTLEIYDNKIEISFIDGTSRQFYFSSWRVKF